MTRTLSMLSVFILLPACFDMADPAPAPAAAPSEAELDALCAARVDAGTESAAISAQERVDTIADRLAEREAELSRLEQEMRNDSKRAQSAKGERDRLAAEVNGLKQQLSTAAKERDAARSELVATLKQLDTRIAEAEAARADADQQRARADRGEWTTFVAQAKTRICDRGTRKRHARCHDAVEAALAGSVRSRFEGCVQTGQAAPELRSLEKGAALPDFAERLPDDRAFTTKGWAIVFCDPALPEPE